MQISVAADHSICKIAVAPPSDIPQTLAFNLLHAFVRMKAAVFVVSARV